MSERAAELEPVSILLVDDRPTNLTALHGLLQQSGYNLVFAHSGAEALALVLRQEFAVILLDVAMPKMDGFETAKIIKQRDQSKLIPIIFVTASVYDMEHIFHGYDVGAVDYLLKPVDQHALRAKVSVFVQLYQQRKEIEKQEARLREAEVREQQLMRLRAEDALQESEELYQLTFEGAPLGIGHAMSDGHWTGGNRRLGELLDCEPEALIGRTVESIGEGEEEQRAIAACLTEIRAGRAVCSIELRLAGDDRRTAVWAEMTIWALRDSSSGDARRVVVIVEDIGERKRNELEHARLLRELQEGIRARDDFLSIAAHELKTPMTPLRLQAASLLRALKKRGVELPQEELCRRLSRIDKSTLRLEVLVDRLLESVEDSITLDREEIDLSARVERAVARLEEEATRVGSSISVHADAVVIGRWDPLRIDQVVTNLVLNAIKYGAGKPIEVSVSADPRTARITVRDHGLGIPEDAQRRIFDRFERVAPLRHFGGFGLGLWIVRRIVEEHGGQVALQSRPREGSEFSILLPRHLEGADSLERAMGVH